MQITKRIPYYLCVALLAYMPFHIFLAQSLSLITGGLDIWKVAKDVIALVGVLFVICLVWQARKGTKLFWWLTGISVAYALFHGILWAANPDIFRDSAILGAAYNIRLSEFLIIGYGAGLLWPQQIQKPLILKLVLGVATIVAFLGVLQYFLPKDILVHFGYGIDRGARAAFFIDDKSGFPRVMSTLREPNALAAYLVVSMALITAYWKKLTNSNLRMVFGGMFGLMGIALLLTFSRSGWMAATLAVFLVAAWQYRQLVVRITRRFGWMILVAVLAFGIFAYVERNSTFVVTYITHSSTEQSEEDVLLDSNDYHWLFLKQGVEGIIDQPLGHGPGTAGLASIQDPKGSFLTENYYVQIGYEIGVLGLFVFLALNVMVYVHLWYRRSHGIAVALLGAFWGYVVMNMLLHTWSNEAVAAQWWLLAGLTLALPITTTKKNSLKAPTLKRTSE